MAVQRPPCTACLRPHDAAQRNERSVAQSPARLASCILLTQLCSYKVLVDGADRGSGPLTDASFEPPLQPPVEVPDPDDIKPEDWVEEEM